MRKSRESFELKNIREKLYRRYISQLNKNQQVLALKTIDKKFIESIRPIELNENYWKDCVYYFIHVILTKTLNQDFKTSRSSFVALNFAELKSVLGIHVSIVINTLESNGVIKKDFKYKKGRESFGYKITNKHLKNYRIDYKTITSSKLKKRLVQYQLKYYEKQKPLISKNAHLLKWYIEAGLEFNKDGANFFLNSLKDALLMVAKELPINNAERQKIFDKIEWLDLYHDFSLRGNLPSFSIQGERLYSEITSMFSPLRNFLSYKDERLVYLDISNSQPFHFCLLLKPKFWQEKNKQGELTLRNQNRKLYEWIKNNKKDELDITIMNLKNLEGSGKTHTNKGLLRKKNSSPHYTHLAATGKLYLFITEKFKGNLLNNKGIDPFNDVYLTKKEFIKMFYFDDKNIHSPSYRHFIEFKKHFPIESSVIQLLKKRSHSDFSVLLQQVESTLLLQNVCRAIFNVYPNMPLFTIHDGILTTESHYKILEEKINEVYNGVFGFTPDLKIEILTPKINMLDFQKIVIKKMNKFLEDLNISGFKFSPELKFEIDKHYITNYRQH